MAEINAVYRHYKNNKLYMVMQFVVDASNDAPKDERMVIYREVDGSGWFARPESEFDATVMVGSTTMKRFEPYAEGQPPA